MAVSGQHMNRGRKPLILLDKTLGHLFCHSIMVEAGRVELPSENLFIQLSPSAAGYLKFPPESASQQAESGGIP